MATTKPSTHWAANPFPLIPTPGRDLNRAKLPDHIYLAREMAFAHNAILRSLNSIYLQCPRVSVPADIVDLLKYAEFWCTWIHEHHGGEETLLFPRIQEITGQKSLMEKNIQQHEAFMGGFKEFEDLVKKMQGEEYDAGKLRTCIDGFGGLLTAHLTDEIKTLVGLEKYSDPALREAWDDFDKEMAKSDAVCSISVQNFQIWLTCLIVHHPSNCFWLRRFH
jgi:hemerythrin-like domain-containing protein